MYIGNPFTGNATAAFLLMGFIAWVFFLSYHAMKRRGDFREEDAIEERIKRIQERNEENIAYYRAQVQEAARGQHNQVQD